MKEMNEMHAHVQAYLSRLQFFNLNFVEEQENRPEQRVTCVCSGKQSVNVQMWIARTWTMIHSLI